MSIPSGRLVLLDTQIIVHLARQNDFGQSIDREFGLSLRVERPLYSTVTEGELLALARAWNWGPKKLEKLHDLLGELVRVEASLPPVIEAYAILYAAGGKTGRTTGENDLWIAATARAAGAVLISDDDGFDWMHPDHLQVAKPTRLEPNQ